MALAPDIRGLHAVDDAGRLRRVAGSIAALGLVEHVAPIQLALRLLVPEGSLLLELEEVQRLVGRVRR